ncbi:GNAT family N-acetyltransferase [Halobacillus litoralis]|uniref:GNAT family N-acetyltransferase n=1 Tax=Halobacillus litoralis TaxID=45668 RepID=UPI001CD27E94|nr:GNAT family protein [Halobacillus litoralis]MCA0969720.1 GNAT family N-acetyltransferase [Halobacillus litoralis]
MDILEENDLMYLRELDQSDWKAHHEYASKDEVCKFQPWGPNNEDDSKFFIAQAIRDREKRHRSRFVFSVILKEEDEIAGSIEMNITDWDGVGEIGFIIHDKHWGKGYATQAVRLMLKHSFEKCELHRVAAVSDPDNVSSIRVLEKIGMKKEGILRKDLYVKGRWRDSVVYGLLKEEWESSQR